MPPEHDLGQRRGRPDRPAGEVERRPAETLRQPSSRRKEPNHQAREEPAFDRDHRRPLGGRQPRVVPGREPRLDQPGDELPGEEGDDRDGDRIEPGEGDPERGRDGQPRPLPGERSADLPANRGPGGDRDPGQPADQPDLAVGETPFGERRLRVEPGDRQRRPEQRRDHQHPGDDRLCPEQEPDIGDVAPERAPVWSVRVDTTARRFRKPQRERHAEEAGNRVEPDRPGVAPLGEDRADPGRPAADQVAKREQPTEEAGKATPLIDRERVVEVGLIGAGAEAVVGAAHKEGEHRDRQGVGVPEQERGEGDEQRARRQRPAPPDEIGERPARDLEQDWREVEAGLGDPDLGEREAAVLEEEDPDRGLEDHLGRDVPGEEPGEGGKGRPLRRPAVRRDVGMTTVLPSGGCDGRGAAVRLALHSPLSRVPMRGQRSASALDTCLVAPEPARRVCGHVELSSIATILAAFQLSASFSPAPLSVFSNVRESRVDSIQKDRQQLVRASMLGS